MLSPGLDASPQPGVGADTDVEVVAVVSESALDARSARAAWNIRPQGLGLVGPLDSSHALPALVALRALAARAALEPSEANEVFGLAEPVLRTRRLSVDVNRGDEPYRLEGALVALEPSDAL